MTSEQRFKAARGLHYRMSDKLEFVVLDHHPDVRDRKATNSTSLSDIQSVE
jgi:hypothetical protein